MIPNVLLPAGCNGDDHSSQYPAGSLAFFEKKIGGRQPALLHWNVGKHVPDQEQEFLRHITNELKSFDSYNWIYSPL